jgi:hypothetical protein
MTISGIARDLLPDDDTRRTYPGTDTEIQATPLLQLPTSEFCPTNMVPLLQIRYTVARE